MVQLNEILEVVDKNNNVVGITTRGECYEKGLLHRAVHIFIFNSIGEVFLTKRSAKKLKYPGYWDLSCGEHVKPGEPFDVAARRGLKEELGIEVNLKQIIPLHRIDSSDEEDKYHDNELIVTFKGIFNGEMKLDPEEVEAGNHFSIKDVNRMIKEGKIKFTPWFLEDWNKLKNTL
jgi:isopentenyl-diphosphate delta-isomerase type 1